MYNVEHGMVSGTSATTFSPNGTMTRGQFVTILARMDGVDTSAVSTGGKFTDVANSAYYAKAVYWAASAGISGGTTASTFSPDMNVTRQQAATFIHRYLSYKGLTLADVSNPTTFKDAGRIDSYAQKAAEAMRLCGLFSGDNNGNFNPDKDMTRAEGVVVFYRLREAAIAAGANFSESSENKNSNILAFKKSTNNLYIGTVQNIVDLLTEDSQKMVAEAFNEAGSFSTIGVWLEQEDLCLAAIPSDSFDDGIVLVPKKEATVEATVKITGGSYAGACASTTFNIVGSPDVEESKTVERSTFTMTVGNGFAYCGKVLSAESDNPSVVEAVVGGIGGGVEPLSAGHANVRMETDKKIFIYDITVVNRPEVEKNLLWIDEQLQSIVREGMSEKDKAVAIAEYICDYMIYDHSKRDKNIPTITVDKEAPSYSEPYGVCHDYAIRYKDFCNQAGLECEYVSGTAPTASSGNAHAWNRVKCDGTWFYIDACWMDGANKNGDYDMYYSLSSDYWSNHYIDGVAGSYTKAQYRYDTEGIIPLYVSEAEHEYNLHVGDRFTIERLNAKKGDIVRYTCTGDMKLSLEHPVYTIQTEGTKIFTLTLTKSGKVLSTITVHAEGE